MSNSTTQLDLISSSQAQKEVTANSLFDAASPAMLYGRRASTSAGLTFGYYGGVVSISGTPTQVGNGTVALTASATNYIEANPADGSVSANTTGFTAGRLPLYQVVAGGSTVTSYTDLRVFGASAAGASAEDIEDAIAAHEAAADPHPDYMTQTEADARYLQSVGAQPFDATVFYPGVPTASAIIDIEFARTVQFAENFAGSALKARVAAAGTTVVAVQKNGSHAGTATFSAGGTAATFSGAAVTFNAGDYLSLVFPSTPDATLANIRGVIAGTR